MLHILGKGLSKEFQTITPVFLVTFAKYLHAHRELFIVHHSPFSNHQISCGLQDTGHFEPVHCRKDLLRRYIDSRAENGVTALHLAAIHGELRCVMALLAAGASMMVRTVDLDMHSSLSIPSGSTPLHLAAQKGQVAIIQAMLQVLFTSLCLMARSLLMETASGSRLMH